MNPFANLLMLTDSYKTSHWRQYPPRTEVVYSFFESRGGDFAKITFFGLQYLLKQHLEGCAFTREDIAQAKQRIDLHMGPGIFNEAGWNHILTAHGGRLPVRIRAVKEGTSWAPRTTLMTVENTDRAVPWLTNYLETILTQVWYPTTVCTQSKAMRGVIMDALNVTGDPSTIDFKLHDFGMRGSTSIESSGIGGAAHLVNFKGTDTMSALMVAETAYNEPMAGFSIPAAEHSTITSWGRDHESDAYLNMLREFPAGLVAVVSDSYDIFNACREIWGEQLKTQVCSRDGVLVVRPDSGHPPSVVVKVLDILGSSFGYTTNRKGYKLLDPHVRVIQGDGIDLRMLGEILDAMRLAGWSADNVAFGSGGGLLQKVNRDTCKFAFKCSAIRRGDEWSDVQKDPVTDHDKKSRSGRFDTPELETVFENGNIVRTQSLAEIRLLASS